MSYITVKDVAAHFRVSKNTVCRLIERGQLPAIRLGPKLLRVPSDALEAFEAELCQATDSTGQSSTESNPGSGTSSGEMARARIVVLRDRLTRQWRDSSSPDTPPFS